MNKRQKAILTHFIVVIILTAIAVAAMFDFKNWVNRSEAMQAMGELGQIVLKYRKGHGAVPSESYVDSIQVNLRGYARLGQLRYRARWIDFDCSEDEILAYTNKDYCSLFFHEGYILLRMNGRVQWMGKLEFEELLASQQSPLEVKMMQE